MEFTVNGTKSEEQKQPEAQTSKLQLPKVDYTLPEFERNSGENVLDYIQRVGKEKALEYQTASGRKAEVYDSAGVEMPEQREQKNTFLTSHIAVSIIPCDQNNSVLRAYQKLVVPQ